MAYLATTSPPCSVFTSQKEMKELEIFVKHSSIFRFLCFMQFQCTVHQCTSNQLWAEFHNVAGISVQKIWHFKTLDERKVLEKYPAKGISFTNISPKDDYDEWKVGAQKVVAYGSWEGQLYCSNWPKKIWWYTSSSMVMTMTMMTNLLAMTLWSHDRFTRT